MHYCLDGGIHYRGFAIVKKLPVIYFRKLNSFITQSPWDRTMKLSRTFGNHGAAVWLALAFFFGTVQPVIAAGSNDIVEKPNFQSSTDTNLHTQAAKSTDYISVKEY